MNAAVTDRRQFVSLSAAEQATKVSRTYIRKLLKARHVRGKFVESYGRWQIDLDSLLRYMRSKGFLVNEQLETVTVVVVGSRLDWVAEFSEHLPVGLRAIYAGSPFDCGRSIETDRPQLAVIDFRLGRGIAVDLARRLLKMSIRCVGLALEDEDDVPGLRLAGFGQVLRTPVKVAAVRDAVISTLE